MIEKQYPEGHGILWKEPNVLVRFCCVSWEPGESEAFLDGSDVTTAPKTAPGADIDAQEPECGWRGRLVLLMCSGTPIWERLHLHTHRCWPRHFLGLEM